MVPGPVPSDPVPPEVPAGWLRIGRLGRTFQLEGGLRFWPAGEAEAEAIGTLDRVFVEGLGESGVLRVRPKGREWILYLDRVRRPERARHLVNADVWADPAELPLPPDAYGESLLGVPLLVDGVPWGEVVEVLRGAQDRVRVRGPRGEALLPLAAPYLQQVGDALRLDDPPAGLLPGPPD